MTHKQYSDGNYPEPQYLGRTVDGDREYMCPYDKDIIIVRDNVFYGICPTCKMTYIDYKPEPHQVEFHASDSKYRLALGGYGTGKTTMCCAEVADHVYSTANGRTLITAPKLQLFEDAIMPELIKFFPKHIYTVKKSPWTFKFINGHEIVVYASNDEENLRSLNLSFFYMEEASNIKHEIFVQLQSRLRNGSAIYYDDYGNLLYDGTKGIVSSNPEQGWLVDEFLMRSRKIFASPSVNTDAYKVLRDDPSDYYESFLSSTRDNSYLPPTYVPSLTAGKSKAWIAKYIDCSMETREGAVYPDFHKCLVPDFPIPDHWQRLYGFDYGFADETATLCGAIDPQTGILYIYSEYYKSGLSTSKNADLISRDYIKATHPRYAPPQADPAILHRSDRDGKSYQSYFYSRSGIWLEPAENSIDVGIDRVRDYMYLGKIKFFQSLENLKNELTNYVYVDYGGKKVPAKNVPDHLADCLRYLVMALPADPDQFSEDIITSNMGKAFMGTSLDKSDNTNVFIGDRLEDDDFENDYNSGVTVGRNIWT